MKSGVIIKPRTREAIRQINDLIQDSDLHAEYDSVENYFFFEEAPENCDKLAEQIDEVIGCNIEFRVEFI